MNGKYVEQNAHDLVFNLLEGAPKTELEEFAEETAQSNAFFLKAVIIGESHYFTVTPSKQADIVFSEVCACVPLSRKREDFIAQIKFDYAKYGNISLPLKGSKYKSKWEIFTWRRGQKKLNSIKTLFNAFTEKIKQGEQGYIALREEFVPSNRGETAPETIVTAEVTEKKITLNTIHTYPDGDNGHIVHTMSTITKS